MRITQKFSPKSDIVLYAGDALSLLKTIPDESQQLIITSPPYNIRKEYESNLSLTDYLDQMVPIAQELNRVLSKCGSLCWQVGNYVESGEKFPLDILFYPIFKGLGLKLRNRIIWHFEHGLHATRRLSDRYETILWFTKSDDYVFNLDDIRIPSKP
jgi:adenine-specific DNA-methyltransferase